MIDSASGAGVGLGARTYRRFFCRASLSPSGLDLQPGFLCLLRVLLALRTLLCCAGFLFCLACRFALTFEGTTSFDRGQSGFFSLAGRFGLTFFFG